MWLEVVLAMASRKKSFEMKGTVDFLKGVGELKTHSRGGVGAA